MDNFGVFQIMPPRAHGSNAKLEALIYKFWGLFWMKNYLMINLMLLLLLLMLLLMMLVLLLMLLMMLVLMIFVQGGKAGSGRGWQSRSFNQGAIIIIMFL